MEMWYTLFIGALYFSIYQCYKLPTFHNNSFQFSDLDAFSRSLLVSMVASCNLFVLNIPNKMFKKQVSGLGLNQPFGKAIANRKTINERIIIKIHKSLLLPGNKAITKTAFGPCPVPLYFELNQTYFFRGEKANK